jgi:hypothetical protein
MVIIVSFNCVYYDEMWKQMSKFLICTCYPWTSEIDVKQGPLMCIPGPLRLL